MTRNMTKPAKWPVCAQRRLGSAWASAQSNQSSLCAHWVAKDLMFLHADRLIWVFAGRTCHIVGFAVTRLTLQTVFILLIIICIITYFVLGKTETKGNHFCRKIQLPIKTLYQNNLHKMLLKPYLWWSKLLNQIFWKGILWKYSIQSLKLADSVWLSLFMRDNVTSLTLPSPGLSATRLPNKILNPTVPKDQKM